MRFYGEIKKTIANDDGTLIVSGVASSESIDSDGEVILSSAIAEAIPEYMKFGAVREMHNNSACGTALSMMVINDKTMFEALVVDPIAVKKINLGVYKGFSIGGKITRRNPVNNNIIEGLKLVEVSLVDRPANPESVFTMVKFEEEGQETDTPKETAIIKEQENTMKTKQTQEVLKIDEEVAKEMPPQEQAPQEQQDPMKLMKEAFAHLYKAVECMKSAGMSYDQEQKTEETPEPKQDEQSEMAYASKNVDLAKSEAFSKIEKENVELKSSLQKMQADLDTLIEESTKAIKAVEAKGFLKAIPVSKEDDGVAKSENAKPKNTIEALKEVYAKGGRSFGHNF